MLPEFSPIETPELAQAIEFSHKTHKVMSELIFPTLEAKALVQKLKKALRMLKGAQLAAARAEIRAALKTAESNAVQLGSLLDQASAIYERAWAKRCKIIDEQRAAWEIANPEATIQMLKRQFDQANRERQDRRTRKAQLIKRALSA